jgi:hypothetical protein
VMLLLSFCAAISFAPGHLGGASAANATFTRAALIIADKLAALKMCIYDTPVGL